jgi:hypothetical protein
MHPSNHAGYRAVISRNMGFFRVSLAAEAEQACLFVDRPMNYDNMGKPD